MNIRPYVVSDQNEIIHLFRLNTPTYFSPDEERDLLKYLERYSANYYVVYDDSTLAGCGGINISKDGKTGMISWDIFHPQYQGKGWGTQLLNYRLQKLAKIKNIEKIIVRTSQLAHNFYEKNGFALVETVQDYWAPGFALYLMEYTHPI